MRSVLIAYAGVGQHGEFGRLGAVEADLPETGEAITCSLPASCGWPDLVRARVICGHSPEADTLPLPDREQCFSRGRVTYSSCCV